MIAFPLCRYVQIEVYDFDTAYETNEAITFKCHCVAVKGVYCKQSNCEYFNIRDRILNKVWELPSAVSCSLNSKH